MALPSSVRDVLSILVFVEDPGALKGICLWLEDSRVTAIEVYIELEGFAKNTSESQLEELEKETKSLENIKRRKFDRLLTGTSENPDSKAFILLEKCRHCNVETYAFVDSPANPSKRFSGGTGNPLRFAPDFLIVIDEKNCGWNFRIGI